MSDAPAAQLTENGVPPTQVIEETPSFKVIRPSLAFRSQLSIIITRSILTRSSLAILRTLPRMKG
jgi:hypothetical protein